MEKGCLLTLVREIQLIHKFKNYFNIPGKVKQSSVALVLRVSPSYQKFAELNTILQNKIKPFEFSNPQSNLLSYQELEQILDKHNTVQFQCVIIQRQIDPKDIHSGQLALPGGHVDEQETDFQSAVREVQEEIGMQLNRNSLYLGKLPKNFYARKARSGENLYTSLNIFLYTSLEKETQFIKQESEVRDVKWINMDLFFNIKQSSIQIYKFQGSFNVNLLPKFMRGQAKTASLNFKYGEFCSIEIGMDNVLWGLTFHFMVYILSLIQKSYIGGPDAPDLNQISKLIKLSEHYNLVFEQNYNLGWIINLISRRIHQQSRVQQFTYQTPQELQKNSNKKIICLSIASLIAASVVAYPFYRSSL
ncbi:NUDIX hydrolase (macronuclear) [Tetrahymena thermophila SB210]|uniref:NUDIX hydrolase n=1 Tax=Tetrahymena thermophila (strain SB210) TaxID=312017 RepID=I7LTG5_TETTS|nr:NUDIX hydrolase [Tetrahymena thermophila SB210]EAR85201.1 NUDIX hydrolase [Tetrahymena thermophila SB210]|eukprot:XP_001032864.1 NUDIX hydrolase [Tetrahymena thermophila SB210]